MANIKLTHCSGLVTVQDFGRVGHQSKGMPVAGAIDEHAFMQANHLVSNTLFDKYSDKSNLSTGALEVYFGELTVTVNQPCIIAITGANCHPIHIDSHQQQINIPMWQPYKLCAGDSIKLHRPKQGIVSYLAFRGGIQTPMFLGSRAQTFSSTIAIDALKPLVTGQLLELADKQVTPLQTNTPKKGKLSPEIFYQNDPLILRFVPHQHWFNLPNHQQEKWLSRTYKVSSSNNRMACQFEQLSEEPITIRHQTKLSSAVNFGTIQVLPDGSPIVLMKDRQTMGGYPTLGNVYQTDLFRLSQLLPGKEVRFIIGNIEQAQSQLNAFYQKFTQQ